MKRVAICVTLVTACLATANRAHASDLTKILRIAFGADHPRYHHPPHPPCLQQHYHLQQQYDLQARAIEHGLMHRAAYQQPWSYRATPFGYGSPYANPPGAYAYPSPPSPSLDPRVGYAPYGRY